MTAFPNSGLDALVARRRPGHSLEAAFYASPEVLDADLRLIFGRHWIFVASEPELPEPGDYVTVGIGRTSVVLVRDDDMAVRAFHNVCRHRGAIIVRERRGFVGNLVCPYHQWTYDLTGRLIHAENMAACIDRGEHGLKPVHVRNLEGLLFICLPVAPDRTLVRTTWLAPKEAVEGVGYDVDRLTQVWRATNEQDATFVSLAQDGAASAGHEPGPYAPAEYMVAAFCARYVERLRAGLDRA